MLLVVLFGCGLPKWVGCLFSCYLLNLVVLV